jgi:hypothetical protein
MTEHPGFSASAAATLVSANGTHFWFKNWRKATVLAPPRQAKLSSARRAGRHPSRSADPRMGLTDISLAEATRVESLKATYGLMNSTTVAWKGLVFAFWGAGPNSPSSCPSRT